MLVNDINNELLLTHSIMLLQMNLENELIPLQYLIVGFGITGYKLETVINNTWPHFQPGQSFSTVFGVFFPTATGVMAGVNMSGDLKNPSKSIPTGSLASLAVRLLFYITINVIWILNSEHILNKCTHKKLFISLQWIPVPTFCDITWISMYK